jgi:hypothetical protein
VLADSEGSLSSPCEDRRNSKVLLHALWKAPLQLAGFLFIAEQLAARPARSVTEPAPRTLEMTTANEQEWLEALNKRAGKLGYQIEPSVTKLGYCLWRSWPGIGRQMILGRDGDVTRASVSKSGAATIEQ